MIIFIVGPYKSGTSHITSILEEKTGIESVVDRTAVVSGCSKDYDIRESYRVNRLNNAIIAEITQSNASNNIFYADQAKELENPHALRRQIQDIYKDYNYHCIIKDPRFLFTLPYWLEELPDRIAYKIVYISRAIQNTCESLRKDGWSNTKINGDYEYIVNRMLNQYYSLQDKYDGHVIDYNYFLDNQYDETKHLLNYCRARIYFLEYYKQGKELLDLYRRQTPNNDGIWNNIIGTTNPYNADYYICSDKTNEISPNYNRTFFFGREPQEIFSHSPHAKIPKENRFHHTYGNSHLPAFWWLDMNYNEILNYQHRKTELLSIIDSGKQLISGHRNRVRFLNGLIEYLPFLKVHSYGYGYNKPLPHRDKTTGLLKYKYHIAIENCRTHYYFSEKITDAFLTLTIPFYYGCYNIHKYFPPQSYVDIDITDPVSACAKIKETIYSDYYEQNIQYLLEARDLVLNKYNIWPTIASKI